MQTQEHYDEIFKAVLKDKSEAINPPQDMFSEINKDLQKNQKLNGSTFVKGLKNHLYPLGLNVRRAVATALCGILVLTALTFALSEDARVFAAKQLYSIGSIFYTIDRDGNDYKIVGKKIVDEGYVAYQKYYVLEDEHGNKSFAHPAPDGGKGPDTKDVSTLSDAEIAKRVRHYVRFPKSLPGGYKLAKKSIMVVPAHLDIAAAAFKSDKPDKILNMQISDQLWSLNDRCFKKLKLGKRTLYWNQYPVPVYPTGKGKPTPYPGQKPDGIKIINAIAWEQSGVCYNFSFQDKQLTEKEILAIADSIVKMK